MMKKIEKTKYEERGRRRRQPGLECIDGMVKSPANIPTALLQLPVSPMNHTPTTQKTGKRLLGTTPP